MERTVENKVDKRRAAVESAVADFGHIGGEADSGDAGASEEGKSADKLRGQFKLPDGRAVGKAVFRNVNPFADRKVADTGASDERILAKLSDSGQIQRFDGLAEAERIFADGVAVFQIHGFEGGASVEGKPLNGLHLFQIDGLQRFVLTEAPLVNLFDGGRQNNLLQIIASVESGVLDFLHALGDNDLGNILVVCECQTVNGGNSLFGRNFHNAVFISPSGIGLEVDAFNRKLFLDADAAGSREELSLCRRRHIGRTGFLCVYGAMERVIRVNGQRDIGGRGFPLDLRGLRHIVREHFHIQFQRFPAFQRDGGLVQLQPGQRNAGTACSSLTGNLHRRESTGRGCRRNGCISCLERRNDSVLDDCHALIRGSPRHRSGINILRRGFQIFQKVLLGIRSHGKGDNLTVCGRIPSALERHRLGVGLFQRVVQAGAVLCIVINLNPDVL